MSFKCMLNFTINLPCFFALLESATFFLDFMFIFFHFPLYVRFLQQCSWLILASSLNCFQLLL